MVPVVTFFSHRVRTDEVFEQHVTRANCEVFFNVNRFTGLVLHLSMRNVRLLTIISRLFHIAHIAILCLTYHTALYDYGT